MRAPPGARCMRVKTSHPAARPRRTGRRNGPRRRGGGAYPYAGGGTLDTPGRTASGHDADGFDDDLGLRDVLGARGDGLDLLDDVHARRHLAENAVADAPVSYTHLT